MKSLFKKKKSKLSPSPGMSGLVAHFLPVMGVAKVLTPRTKDENL